jgi:broad specificity phosphatase PhoE
MSVELYHIRHGETLMNANPTVVGGRSNWVELSPLGKEQAWQRGEYFLDQGIIPTRFITTPAVRAIDSGSLMLQAMDLAITPSLDYKSQELDKGEWTGRPRGEVYTRANQAQQRFAGLDARAPGGQSYRELGLLMLESLADIATMVAESEQDERIFVIGHGMAQRCMAATFYGWSREQILSAKTPNTSFSKLTLLPSGWNLDYFAHLPEQSSEFD